MAQILKRAWSNKAAQPKFFQSVRYFGVKSLILSIKSIKENP